jgi:hypothetical protein
MLFANTPGQPLLKKIATGGAMLNLISIAAPVGCLYDPLAALASRMHRVLGVRRKTAWTDDLGSVFLDNADRMPSTSTCSIVGTYDALTPWQVIESDLRVALRARASRWITDWNKQHSSANRKEYQVKSLSPPRGRPIRTRAAIIGMPLQPVATPSIAIDQRQP